MNKLPLWCFIPALCAIAFVLSACSDSTRLAALDSEISELKNEQKTAERARADIVQLAKEIAELDSAIHHLSDRVNELETSKVDPVPTLLRLDRLDKDIAFLSYGVSEIRDARKAGKSDVLRLDSETARLAADTVRIGLRLDSLEHAVRGIEDAQKFRLP